MHNADLPKRIAEGPYLTPEEARQLEAVVCRAVDGIELASVGYVMIGEGALHVEGLPPWRFLRRRQATTQALRILRAAGPRACRWTIVWEEM